MENIIPLEIRGDQEKSVESMMESLIREGARKILMEAFQAEVEKYLLMFSELKDKNNRRMVTRNGFHKERVIQTGIGDIKIKQPRVRDRRPDLEFNSSILPKYLRRIPSLDSLIPALYLKGISTGDFPSALEAILGKDAKNLSAKTVERLKAKWQDEYKEWSGRTLNDERFVYIWADGIYFKTRLGNEENRKQCVLVIIGALKNGTKKLLAVKDGYRESEISWMEVLTELKKQGLTEPPELAVGDGALGFWAALRKIFPTTKEQRCWVHKTANILDKMPKCEQVKAKSMIHNMYLSETKEEGKKHYEHFLNHYSDRFPGACKCLKKNEDSLFTFYDFPAVQWQHIRSTNPIESTFATVRLRTKRTKGCGNRMATLTMVFKLAKEAEKKWRKLKGSEKLGMIISGVKFRDGYTEDEWKIKEKKGKLVA